MNMIANPNQSMTIPETESADLNRVIDMTSRGVMLPQIIFAVLVLLIGLGVDIPLNNTLWTPQLNQTATGQPMDNAVMTWAASCLTALAFLGAGGAYAAGWKWIAGGIGVCIALTLVFLVAPMTIGRVQELSALIGLDRTVTGEGFLPWLLWGALGAANILLITLGVAAFSTLYAMAGGIAAAAEYRLSALLSMLRIRARVMADIARRKQCRLPIQTLAAINRLIATTPETRDKAALQAVNTAYAVVKRGAMTRTGKPTAI